MISKPVTLPDHRPPADNASSNAVVVHFLFWSSVYYFVERAMKTLAKRRWPQTYDNIVAQGKIAAFFGIAMGSLITSITTPICTIAYLRYSPARPVDFAHIGAQEVCLAGRGILWVQELSRLGDSTVFLLHHIGSLISLFYILSQNLPPTALLAIYTSLVSEMGTNTVWLASACGRGPEKSRWVWGIEWLSAMSLATVRGPAIVIATREILALPRSAHVVACVVFLAVYAAFIVYLFVKRVEKLGIVSFQWNKPGYLEAVGVRISTYGLCVSLGLIPAAAYATFIFNVFPHGTRKGPTNEAFRRGELATLIIRSTAMSILGSRVMAILCDYVIARKAYPGSVWSTLFRRRFYVQGAVIGCATAILGSSDVPRATRIDALAVGAVVLPLYEAIGRVGCHFAGCCHGIPLETFKHKFPRLNQRVQEWEHFLTVTYSSPDTTVVRNSPRLKDTKLVALQIALSSAFGAVLVFTSSLLFIGWIDLREAGAISLIMHGIIRSGAETFRDDNRAFVSNPCRRDDSHPPKPKSVPALFAWLQAAVGTLLLAVAMAGRWSLSEHESLQTASADRKLPDWISDLADVHSITKLVLSVTILGVCYGLEIPKRKNGVLAANATET